MCDPEGCDHGCDQRCDCECDQGCDHGCDQRCDCECDQGCDQIYPPGHGRNAKTDRRCESGDEDAFFDQYPGGGCSGDYETSMDTGFHVFNGDDDMNKKIVVTYCNENDECCQDDLNEVRNKHITQKKIIIPPFDFEFNGPILVPNYCDMECCDAQFVKNEITLPENCLYPRCCSETKTCPNQQTHHYTHSTNQRDYSRFVKEFQHHLTDIMKNSKSDAKNLKNEKTSSSSGDLKEKMKKTRCGETIVEESSNVCDCLCEGDVTKCPKPSFMPIGLCHYAKQKPNEKTFGKKSNPDFPKRNGQNISEQIKQIIKKYKGATGGICCMFGKKDPLKYSAFKERRVCEALMSQKPRGECSDFPAMMCEVKPFQCLRKADDTLRCRLSRHPDKCERGIKKCKAKKKKKKGIFGKFKGIFSKNKRKSKKSKKRKKSKKKGKKKSKNKGKKKSKKKGNKKSKKKKMKSIF